MNKAIRFAYALAGVTLLASCAVLMPHQVPSHESKLSGMTLDEVRNSSQLAKDSREHTSIAIVLGGGGLRGYAHIGVLQALEENGIVPDTVVGTSIGAIIGAAYASGSSPNQLWEQAKNTQVYSLADVALSGSGFIKGEALARWANSLVAELPIERFPKRFAAVATDLERTEPIVLLSGDAGQAARASAAIPGIFSPVPYQGGKLVDGGVLSIVPVRTARAMGANIVIGVDVYCHSPRFESSTPLSAILRVTQAQSCIIARDEMGEADVLISPSVVLAGADDALGRERARQAGYDAGYLAVAKIKALMATSSPQTASNSKKSQIYSR